MIYTDENKKALACEGFLYALNEAIDIILKQHV